MTDGSNLTDEATSRHVLSDATRSGRPSEKTSGSVSRTNAIFLEQAEQLGRLGCFEWDILTNKVQWSD
ncbi:MAG: hypothetical protein KDA99_18035, partial [Planctomycetales bacterium]|nr:hypothetical protein [Planctomycetales bacterium]